MTEQFLPPEDTEAEEALLGALLINPDAIDEIRQILQPSDFFILKNRWLYEAILVLHDSDSPIEALTLEREVSRHHSRDLKPRDIQARYDYLMRNTPTALHAEIYASLIERKATRRRIREAASQIAQLAHDETLDTIEVCEKAEIAIYDVTQRKLSTYQQSNYDVGLAAFDDLSRRIDNYGKAEAGLPTGYYHIDSMALLQRNELCVIGARSASGKSAFAVNLVLGAIRRGVKVGFAALEMDTNALYRRLVGIDTGINTQALKTGNVTDDERNLAFESLNNLTHNNNLFWYTQRKKAFEHLRSQVRAWKRGNGLDMLVVDYLSPGLVVPSCDRRESPEQKYATLAYDFYEMAQEFNICVVCLSQLNREVFKAERPSKRHLRFSDAIEFASDVIAILDVPELRGEDESPFVVNHPDPSALAAVLYFDKVRDGPGSDMPMVFVRSCQRFEVPTLHDVHLG